jgi:hypothetical protein
LVVRKLAGIALAAGVLFSVAGCSFNPHPESLQSYAPSDGVGVDINFDKTHRNESVKLRNFVLISENGTSALFGTVINSGNKSEDITIQLASDHTQQQTVTVPAGQTFVFDSKTSTLKIEGKPGTLIDLAAGVANGTNWQKLSVPVLDGTIDYYQNLLGSPSAAPSATPSASPSN